MSARADLIRRLRRQATDEGAWLSGEARGLLFEAADALERAPAEPLGDDVMHCRTCGERIISTPDGAVCLGGHAK